MKPKDSVWEFYDLVTEGNKTISKCKACSSEVSSKVQRLKAHLEKCQKAVIFAKDTGIIFLSKSEPWKSETATPSTPMREQEETNDDSLHVNTPKPQLEQTLNGFTFPTSAIMKDKQDEKFTDSCFLTFPKMAEQQVSEDLESAEYKKLLKYVLRKQIQLLVNQLNEETGEETVVLSANLTSGATTYLGSELARTYLEENSAWKTDFLSFLLTKNILRKGADATANKPKTSKPFKAAKESSDLASKSPTGTGLNINKGKSKSIVTAAETDTSYDDASQQLESKATNNKRKPAESPQSQTPRKSQKQSNLKGISTESCSVETLEMDAYTEAEQTALLNRSESFLFKDINRSEISEASEMNMTNLIPQSSVQDNPMFQPTIPIISTDANVDMGIDNAALGFPGISSDTNMGEIYIKIEPQEDSDSADVDYGNSGIEEANISDNPHSDQNTHSGEDNDRGLDNNGCSNKQQPSVQNMCANKEIKEEVLSEGSDAKDGRKRLDIGKDGSLFYSCTVCNKHFTELQYLLQHQLTYKGTTKICQQCGRAFHRQCSYTRHFSRCTRH